MKRTTACGGNCETCGGACADGGRLRAVAVNRVGAAVGDLVTISSRSSRILSAAALVYLLPLAAFFLGYAAASLLGLSEKGAVAASLCGFVLGLAAAVMISRKRRAIVIEIVERL